MKKTLTTLALALVTITATFAQVGIGTKTPAPSAVLELSTTTKGFLPPRVNTTQRDAIASPPAGLVVYNTTTNRLEFSNGTSWINLVDGSVITAVNATANSGSGGVAIGTNSPNAASILDLTATNKGFLPPRMTTAQRGAITSPATGLTIYNTEVGCLQYFNGTGWVNACDGSGTGSIPGNATCATATISVTPCSAVSGATLNDDNTTPDGTEYDWTGATGFVAGGTTQALVEIGGQCWYRRNAENIPSNFNPVPNFVRETDVGWSGVYTGGPFPNEGRLYQWSAAMNGSTTERAQGVCPTGWHVPSDCEWMYLENTLGMTVAEQETNGFRGSEAQDLSSLVVFGGTNSSGFTGLLAGYRTDRGGFSARGAADSWYSSTQDASGNVKYRSIFASSINVFRSSLIKGTGETIRCIKD